MANNSAKVPNNVASSSWDSFKMPAGGTASEIRRSVAEMRNTVSQETKVLSGAYIQQALSKPKR